MKSHLTISLLFITLQTISGQEEINRFSPDGLKVGKWVIYHKNGNIESIQYYSIVRKKLTPEQLFEAGFDDKIKWRDSLQRIEARTGTWHYFHSDNKISSIEYYNDQGEKIKTEGFEYLLDGTIVINGSKYILGKKDTILLTRNSLQESAPSKNKIDFKLEVENISNHELKIKILPNSVLEYKEQIHSLAPFVKTSISIPIQWPSGKVNEKIRMEAPEWKLNIDIRGFGYDLSKIDFENKSIKKLPSKFFFYKDGEEYQIEFLRYGDNDSPIVVPLSSKLVPLELRNGAYELALIGPGWRLRKDIIIE